MPRPGTVLLAAGRRPRLAMLGTAGAAAGAAGLAGGPVAAVVAGMYGWLAAAEWLRRAARRRAGADRGAALERLGSLVAELRAGVAGPLPVDVAEPSAGDDRIGRLSAAVWRLAERTGAPAADLLERLEADARAADRAAASAAAQAAGAQATALLLAGLPLGGLGLGYLIGTDPLHVLLRTPVGAACAITAVLLQCAGLRWAQRLVEGPAR